MRFFEKFYRLREDDDVLARLTEIFLSLDTRIDAVELVKTAFEQGNRLDVDALLNAINQDIAQKSALMAELIAEAAGGFAADRIIQTALLRFTSDAEQQAIVDAITAANSRIDARATSASLGAHTARSDNPHAVTAAQVGTLTTAQIDEDLEILEAMLKGGVSTDFNNLAKLANALALRVRTDAAQGLDAASQRQARANISAIGNLLRAPVVYTSSGSYTPGADVKAIVVEVLGGGGGGGGASATASLARVGNGGNAGTLAIRYVAAPAGPYSIVIGAGGSAGSVGDNAGGDGGASSFGALVTAPGGKGGVGSGTATGSTIVGGALDNDDPTGGNVFSTRGEIGGSSLKLSADNRIAGRGGSSRYGSGGRGAPSNANTSSQTGTAGTGRGSGGSGGLGATTTSVAGGARPAGPGLGWVDG